MKSLLFSLVLSLSLLGATAQEKTTTKVQCSGITAKGTQCTRMLSSGTFCYQHMNSHDNSTKTVDSTNTTARVRTQCIGITAKGTRCSRNAAKNSTACFQHQNQIK